MSSVQDPFQGVKVEVISEGRTFNLYDDPEASDAGANPDPYSRNLFVQEAIPGAKFEVRIVICREFSLYDLYDEDGVKTAIRYDGQGLWNFWIADKKKIVREIAKNKAFFFTFSHNWEYSGSFQQWRRGQTVFMPLAIDEENDRATDIRQQQVKHLGCFEVCVQRVRLRTRQTSREFHPNKIEPITGTPEKLVKGNAVASITRIQDTFANVPQLPPYDWSFLDGDQGRELKFNIRYRSKDTLQAIGCIPRTPSPEPNLADEIQVLRDRLAILERSAGGDRVKTEASQFNAIKRERDVSRDESDRKRIRRSQVEVVDLTDD